MKTSRIAFIFLLIFGLGVVAMAQGEVRAVSTWQVVQYEVESTLPTGERDRTMTVRANISLKNVSGKLASALTLRTGSIAELTALKVNDAAVEFVKSEEKVSSSLSLVRNVAKITGVAAGGTISVVVDYKITLKDNTGSSTMSPSTVQFLPTSYWYTTPNSWFFARGADNAPVTIRFGNLNGRNAVAAGVETSGNFAFDSSGQPFFSVGNWDITNTSGVSIYSPKGESAAAKRASELASLLSEAKTFAEQYLGKPANMPLRVVSVRRGAGYTGGGVVLVDESVFRRQKIDSLTAMNISEAAVRTWIGGSIATGGEGYGIVRDGLVRYIATEFIDSKYGKDVADVERTRQRTAYSAISRRDGPMSRISPLDDFYYSSVSNKGAMAWRLIANRIGKAEFTRILKANSLDGDLNLTELRTAFGENKELSEALFDQVTDTNLLVGIPQLTGGESKVALRNTGTLDSTVNVRATFANGQTMDAPTTIKATSYGDVTFKNASKIERVEIDTEKLYPQIEYSDDVAPKESSDSDPILTVKRLFDKKDFAGAEAAAKIALRDRPRFDDVRVLLGRAQLGQNKFADAERSFQAALDDKLPTSRTLAWANVGLAEAAAASNATDKAATFITAAISADADLGASLAARNLRNKIGGTTSIDPTVKTFFAEFDRAAMSNRKTELDALFVAGEALKFVSGLSGSTEQWQTVVRQVDKLGVDTVLVEAILDIRLLTKEPENRTAIFRLLRVGNAWKIAAVESFELR